MAYLNLLKSPAALAEGQRPKICSPEESTKLAKSALRFLVSLEIEETVEIDGMIKLRDLSVFNGSDIQNPPTKGIIVSDFARVGAIFLPNGEGNLGDIERCDGTVHPYPGIKIPDDAEALIFAVWRNGRKPGWCSPGYISMNENPDPATTHSEFMAFGTHENAGE